MKLRIMSMSIKISMLVPAFLCFLLACSSGPRPVQYGQDTCVHCEMTIIDSRYGTEIVTEKGKVYTFDSIECLVEFFQNNLPEGESAKSIFLTPFDKPGNLFDAENGQVLYCLAMPSPMGKYLTAFDNPEKADSIRVMNGGKLFKWSDLLNDYNHLDPSLAE